MSGELRRATCASPIPALGTRLTRSSCRS